LAADDAQAFIAEPVWEGRPRETTSLSRQQDVPLIRGLVRVYGNGLLTRLLARLAELAAIPGQLRRWSERLDSAADAKAARGVRRATGVGVGQVEAARGRLIHRVEIRDETVRGYQILAPTEWNFHPRGVVARGLAALGSGDAETLRQQAALLIDAVDPCVGYDLRVH
jgi:Ni,Fe-hydrogenase I large subunit